MSYLLCVCLLSCAIFIVTGIVWLHDWVYLPWSWQREDKAFARRCRRNEEIDQHHRQRSV